MVLKEPPILGAPHVLDRHDRVVIERAVDVREDLFGVVVAPFRGHPVEVDRDEQVEPQIASVVPVRRLDDALTAVRAVDEALGGE